MSLKQKFQFSQKKIVILINLIKYILFSLVTSKSNKLFNRGRDKLSIIPQTEGIYEPVLNEYLNFCVNNKKMSDFFIDIGANIGLISCQCGKLFKRVICFEPNPLCFNILKVNTAISLDPSKLLIYEYGLGKSDEELNLWIPKNNWGGAFVRTIDNSYNDTTLAKKDSFIKLDKNNYIIQKVKICSTENELKRIFNLLIDKNLTKGIVKIDVEGMELTILNGLSKILPKNVKIDIVFENWDDNLNISTLKKIFNNREILLYKFNNKVRFKNDYPKIIKGLLMLLSSNLISLEEIKKNENMKGDIVINIL